MLCFFKHKVLMVYKIFPKISTPRAVLILFPWFLPLFLEDLFNTMVKITKFSVSSEP